MTYFKKLTSRRIYDLEVWDEFRAIARRQIQIEIRDKACLKIRGQICYKSQVHTQVWNQI